MAHGISQEKMDEIGLDSEQVNVLKKCFDGFCQDGSIRVDTIGSILTMMGLRVKPTALKEIIDEVDILMHSDLYTKAKLNTKFRENQFSSLEH